MSSPNDNIAMKDGGDNPFSLRSKDVSASQNGSLQKAMHLAAQYPVDYGIGGCYKLALRSGSMAAGLGSSAPVFSLRNSSAALNVILRKLRFNFWTLGTGFAAGVAQFDLFVARSFTASDSGGTTINLASKNGAQRTSMAVSALGDLRISSTGALTAGTRTLDANPFASVTVGAPTTANTPMSVTPITLYDRGIDEHPLLLAQNEGIVIQATVPATGVWALQVDPNWEEVPLVNY